MKTIYKWYEEDLKYTGKTISDFNPLDILEIFKFEAMEFIGRNKYVVALGRFNEYILKNHAVIVCEIASKQDRRLLDFKVIKECSINVSYNIIVEAMKLVNKGIVFKEQ